MPRSLHHRIEVSFPVLEPMLQRQIELTLDIQLADTVKAWTLLPDGRSERVRPSAAPARSQERLDALAAPAEAVAPGDPAGGTTPLCAATTRCSGPGGATPGRHDVSRGVGGVAAGTDDVSMTRPAAPCSSSWPLGAGPVSQPRSADAIGCR